MGATELVTELRDYFLARDDVAFAWLFGSQASGRDFTRDFRRSVERWVENLVNASIDAAKIVIASERRPVPQTHRRRTAR